MANELTPNQMAALIAVGLKMAREEAAISVRELLPIDTIVRVELGGHLVTLQVNGYGWEATDPLEVRGLNRVTGKQRKFNAGYDAFTIAELPGEKGGRG